MTTAQISIAPENDFAVTELHGQAIKVLEWAKSRTITTTEDLKLASSDLTIISGLKKQLEEHRKKYTGPLNDYLKTFNTTFKTFFEPVEEADKITRRKILDYEMEQKRIREEQERINHEKIELARREAQLNHGEFTVDTTPIEVLPEVTRVQTDLGTTNQVMVKKWEVVNQAEIPEEYKIVDAVKIGKLVRAGIPSIPGIRIYEEPTLRVTKRS